MRHLLDLLYLFALLVLSPWLLYKALTTGKYRRGMLAKFLGCVAMPPATKPRVWFHGVSVGEIHMLRQVVAAFRQRHPDWECVVSTTTEMGFAEARKHFVDLNVFLFPLDFSWAVRRAMRTVAPSLIVLAEGELWPNFLLTAKANAIPVVVVNARLSPRSAARHRHWRWLTRPLWNAIDLIAVQTKEYADNFRSLGIPDAKLVVTGNVKYDGINLEEQEPRIEAFRRLFNVQRNERVWVCGSTQAPEEEVALRAWIQLTKTFPSLRLILVPRQRERFEEVASLLQSAGVPFVRRSTLTEPMSQPGAVLLLDSFGELEAVWGLAEVAFVGGSLDGKRGGQNMIQPAAYGVGVIFGPHTWNFRDAVQGLLAAGGAVQINDATQLEGAVRDLLLDHSLLEGAAAKRFVREQQGATARTMAAIDAVLRPVERQSEAA